MKAVRFERPWSLYNPGDIAGFDADTASALIKSGVAVAYATAAPPSRGKRAAPAKAG